MALELQELECLDLYKQYLKAEHFQEDYHVQFEASVNWDSKKRTHY